MLLQNDNTCELPDCESATMVVSVSTPPSFLKHTRTNTHTCGHAASQNGIAYADFFMFFSLKPPTDSTACIADWIVRTRDRSNSYVTTATVLPTLIPSTDLHFLFPLPPDVEGTADGPLPCG